MVLGPETVARLAEPAAGVAFVGGAGVTGSGAPARGPTEAEDVVIKLVGALAFGPHRGREEEPDQDPPHSPLSFVVRVDYVTRQFPDNGNLFRG